MIKHCRTSCPGSIASVTSMHRRNPNLFVSSDVRENWRWNSRSTWVNQVCLSPYSIVRLKFFFDSEGGKGLSLETRCVLQPDTSMLIFPVLQSQFLSVTLAPPATRTDLIHSKKIEVADYIETGPALPSHSTKCSIIFVDRLLLQYHLGCVSSLFEGQVDTVSLHVQPLYLGAIKASAWFYSLWRCYGSAAHCWVLVPHSIGFLSSERPDYIFCYSVIKSCDRGASKIDKYPNRARFLTTLCNMRYFKASRLKWHSGLSSFFELVFIDCILIENGNAIFCEEPKDPSMYKSFTVSEYFAFISVTSGLFLEPMP